MSREEITPFTVHILEKEYRVACAEQEKDALLASAHHLGGKMKEIRDTGKVIGLERIAVMAALNITHELLQHKSRKEDYTQSMSGKVRSLQDKVDAALSRSKQMEI
ncbi:MAG: cell division protein ZapA [Gammaproteobacteria bacterium]